MRCKCLNSIIEEYQIYKSSIAIFNVICINKLNYKILVEQVVLSVSIEKSLSWRAENECITSELAPILNTLVVLLRS